MSENPWSLSTSEIEFATEGSLVQLDRLLGGGRSGTLNSPLVISLLEQVCFVFFLGVISERSTSKLLTDDFGDCNPVFWTFCCKMSPFDLWTVFVATAGESIREDSHNRCFLSKVSLLWVTQFSKLCWNKNLNLPKLELLKGTVLVLNVSRYNDIISWVTVIFKTYIVPFNFVNLLIYQITMFRVHMSVWITEHFWINVENINLIFSHNW